LLAAVQALPFGFSVFVMSDYSERSLVRRGEQHAHSTLSRAIATL
jgi:hypothetical protein